MQTRRFPQIPERIGRLEELAYNLRWSWDYRGRLLFKRLDPDVRRTGLGRSLLCAAEDWARSMGYTEMASDALIDNDVSHAAHKRSGYEEVDRVVTYRKSLR